MADISKIKIGETTYNIKDAGARALIAGITASGLKYIIAYDGHSETPDLTKIPSAAEVFYDGSMVSGTLAASDADKNTVYFVKVGTVLEAPNIYDEYMSVINSDGLYQWELIGDTKMHISDYATDAELAAGLAGKIDKLSAAANGAIIVGGASADKVASSGKELDTDTTGYGIAKLNALSSAIPNCLEVRNFVKDYVKVQNLAIGGSGTASAITALGTPSSDTFVKSVTATKSKLVTTSIPNVTSVGSPSSWSFAMGTGDDAETLIISGGNGSAPTLGTAITAATGALDANGAGASVATDASAGSTDAALTGLGTPTTEQVLTGVQITTPAAIAVQPY